MARFIEGSREGEVNAEVGLVICNNSPTSGVGVYDKVTDANQRYGLEIETLWISSETHPGNPFGRGQTGDEARAIYEALQERQIEFVLTLGYMKVINGMLMKEFGWKAEYAEADPDSQGIYLGRMINTHPGILPQTKDTHGIGASQRVLDLGLPQTAHTLHMVAADVDGGPTIAENRVDVVSGMTAAELFDAVQAAEKANLCGDIDRYFSERAAYLASHPPV